jgi:tetratricopeptide (TPR) repeat protein
MKKSIFYVAESLVMAFLAPVLFFPTIANGQGTAAAGPVNNSVTSMDGRQAQMDMTDKYLLQQLGDPREQAAYQAFHKVSETDGDKKVHLGLTFLSKYPGDRYSSAVYEELSQTYYDKKDLPSFYTYSEKGLTLFPDDVHLLALTGWIIPHAFDSHAPDADKKLDKAEIYEKHALDVIDKLVKPAGVPDDQFAQYKTGEAAIVHSGLGLIYFRREQYETSAKELETATKNEVTPDPTDFSFWVQTSRTWANTRKRRMLSIAAPSSPAACRTIARNMPTLQPRTPRMQSRVFLHAAQARCQEGIGSRRRFERLALLSRTRLSFLNQVQR